MAFGEQLVLIPLIIQYAHIISGIQMLPQMFSKLKYKIMIMWWLVYITTPWCQID